MASRELNKNSKRRYSDEEKAKALAALAANGGNVKRTARELQLPTSTLRRWIACQESPCGAQMRHQKKGALADGLEAVVWSLLEGVSQEKINGGNLKEIFTAIGIAVDKMQLLRGRPTIIGHHDFSELSDAELDHLLAEEEGKSFGTPSGETPQA